MGRPHNILCALYTGEVVNSSDVNITWIGPNGVITNDNTSRITVLPTISDGHNHTSTLQFSYLSDSDENTTYSCDAYLPGDHKYTSFTIRDLTSKLDLITTRNLQAYMLAIASNYISREDQLKYTQDFIYH